MKCIKVAVMLHLLQGLNSDLLPPVTNQGAQLLSEGLLDTAELTGLLGN